MLQLYGGILPDTRTCTAAYLTCWQSFAREVLDHPFFQKCTCFCCAALRDVYFQFIGSRVTPKYEVERGLGEGDSEGNGRRDKGKITITCTEWGKCSGVHKLVNDDKQHLGEAELFMFIDYKTPKPHPSGTVFIHIHSYGTRHAHPAVVPHVKPDDHREIANDKVRNGWVAASQVCIYHK